MAKLTRNTFIEKHRQATKVGFDFADSRTLVHRSGKAPTKGRPRYRLLRFRDPLTGKEIPTPNKIITALAKSVLKSDYFVKSGAPVGTVQALFIKDDTEAAALAAQFPHGPRQPDDGKPATSTITVTVDEKTAISLARKLNLL